MIRIRIRKMVYCSVCCHDVSYSNHWSSIYKKINICMTCRSEKDLVNLPEIIKKICILQVDLETRCDIFSNVSIQKLPNADHIYNNDGICVYSNIASICYMAFESLIQTKIEEFIWNAFKTGNYLESQNKIEEHELNVIKYYFARNMPSFVTRENIDLTYSMNLLNTMKI